MTLSSAFRYSSRSNFEKSFEEHDNQVPSGEISNENKIRTNARKKARTSVRLTMLDLKYAVYYTLRKNAERLTAQRRKLEISKA